MSLRKIITNTLAIVGAVVVIDKIVEIVTTKGNEAVCNALNNDEDYDLSDSCECGCECSNSDYVEADCQCEDNCSCTHEDDTLPEIKKYEDNPTHSFEYTIKAENISSESKEV